jgi:NAD(P)-dependent dehydrogenase (short-subunit alcohol dehydrogenase family)
MAMANGQAGVAVVTGGASGIGLAIARRAGADGMSVVVADVDAGRLGDARAELAASGVQAATWVTDVAQRESVDALATFVNREVGEVALLVNNAGVFTPTPFLGTSNAEWEFVLGVNLWGVINTLDAFLPGMVERDRGYVVNTSSVSGLVTTPHATSYVVSKHAVVALSETVFRDLSRRGSNVGVTVLCPGAVPTNILRSIRLWPERLGPTPDIPEVDYPEVEGMMEPDEVADRLFADIAARRFWSLPDTDRYAASIRARAEEIVTASNPSDASGDRQI